MCGVWCVCGVCVCVCVRVCVSVSQLLGTKHIFLQDQGGVTRESSVCPPLRPFFPGHGAVPVLISGICLFARRSVAAHPNIGLVMCK